MSSPEGWYLRGGQGHGRCSHAGTAPCSHCAHLRRQPPWAAELSSSPLSGGAEARACTRHHGPHLCLCLGVPGLGLLQDFFKGDFHVSLHGPCTVERTVMKSRSCSLSLGRGPGRTAGLGFRPGAAAHVRTGQQCRRGGGESPPWSAPPPRPAPPHGARRADSRGGGGSQRRLRLCSVSRGGGGGVWEDGGTARTPASPPPCPGHTGRRPARTAALESPGLMTSLHPDAQPPRRPSSCFLRLWSTHA